MAWYDCPRCERRFDLSATEHCPDCGRAWYRDYDLEDEQVVTDGGETEKYTDGTEQTGPIYIYWAACGECGYTTAVHGRARCPDCDETLAPYDIAGAVVDSEVRSAQTDTDRSGEGFSR